MRLILILALALTLAGARPSLAQTADQSAAPAAEQASADSATLAAHDFLSAFMFESGWVPTLFQSALRAPLPQLRAGITSEPFYAALSPEGRRAVDAVFERLPAIAGEELDRATPAIIAAGAPRMLELFDETQLTEMTAFLRTETGQLMLTHSTAAGIDAVEGGQTPLTPLRTSDRAAIDAFFSTPAGDAMRTRFDALHAATGQIGSEALASIEAPIRRRFFSELCAAAGEHCPADIREMAER